MVAKYVAKYGVVLWQCTEKPVNYIYPKSCGSIMRLTKTLGNITVLYTIISNCSLGSYIHS